VTIEGDEAHTIAGRFDSSLRLLPADEFLAWPCPLTMPSPSVASQSRPELQIGRRWPPGRSAGRN